MKKKRTFTQLLYATTEPSMKRMSKAEMRRLGLHLLTKKQLDDLFRFELKAMGTLPESDLKAFYDAKHK